MTLFPIQCERLAWALVVALPFNGRVSGQQTSPPPKQATNQSALSSNLNPRIAIAVDRGIENLMRQQHRDGSWTGTNFEKFPVGPTAFSAFALVEAGLSTKAPAIEKALHFLRAHTPAATYSIGSLLLLLAEINDPANRGWAEDLVDQLLAWESKEFPGTWPYPWNRPDLSNTQFVALGLWSAWRMGIDPPLKVSKRIALGVHEFHQEEPRASSASRTRGATRVAANDVAGFRYSRRRNARPASGVMTASGVGVLRVFRLIHGKKLGRKLLRSMDDWEEMGLNWLEENWSTSGVHPLPEQQLVYLYAIERLGAFLDSDRIVDHLWYEPGARVVLSLQEENGGWGNLAATAYALLFLSRASHPSATGMEREPSDDQWGHEKGVVRLRATGHMEIVAWIESIDSDQDLRIAAVDWLVDGNVVETLEADTSRVWSSERFPLRWSTTVGGERELMAVVRAIGADGQAVELRSNPLQIQCRWTPKDWLRLGGPDPGRIPIDKLEATIDASSEHPDHPATHAIDGFEGTAWIASPSDVQPSLRIRFGKPKRAESLLISHPASSIENLTRYQGVTRIRITVNGKSIEHELPAQSAGPISIPLTNRSRIRTLDIQVLASTGPESRLRGFAEIGLQD